MSYLQTTLFQSFLLPLLLILFAQKANECSIVHNIDKDHRWANQVLFLENNHGLQISKLFWVMSNQLINGFVLNVVLQQAMIN